MVVDEPSPPPSTNLKGKRAYSPTLVKGAGKVKKSKGPSFPLDLVPTSSKMSVIEATGKVMMPSNLEVATSTGVGEALEGWSPRCK